MPVYEYRETVADTRFTLDTDTMRVQRERDAFQGAYVRDLSIRDQQKMFVPISPEMLSTIRFDQMRRNTTVHIFDNQGHPVWFSIVFGTSDPNNWEQAVLFKAVR